MSIQVRAVFEHGTLRPLGPVGLAEKQEVMVTIEDSVTAPPERLASVLFLAPATIRLEFADATFDLPIERLDMPVDQLDWQSASAAPTGNQMRIKSYGGDEVSIDAASLRYLADVAYAAQVDASIRSLQMSADEARQAAELSMRARDPRWHEIGDEDDL